MAEGGRFARAVREIARIEVRRLARDRRALFSAIVLPALIYPVFFHGQAWLKSVSRESIEARTVRVALDLADAPPEVAERIELRLSQEVPIELVPIESEHLREVTAALRELQGDLYEGRPAAQDRERALVAKVFGEGNDLLLLAAPHSVLPSRLLLRVHFDGSDETSVEALGRARRALLELEVERRSELLRAALGTADPARGLDLLSVDVATAADAGGAALGRLLPLLAVLVLVAGGSYAALGCFAGEREAGTLETLLAQPVSGAAVSWGKFAAVLVVALAALVTNVGSMLVSLALGLGALPGLEPGGNGAAVLQESGGRLLVGALVFVPSAVTVCAALALASARSRSFREGQHLLLPLSLVAAVPAAVAGWTDVGLEPLLALVPLFGPCLALRDALRGTLDVWPAALAWVASAGWAVLALRALARTLDAERILQQRHVEREAEVRRLQSRGALRWGAASLLVVYVAGGWAQSRWPLGGLMFTLWALMPLLAWLAVRGTARRARESLPRALGLVLPRARHALRRRRRPPPPRRVPGRSPRRGRRRSDSGRRSVRRRTPGRSRCASAGWPRRGPRRPDPAERGPRPRPLRGA